MNTLCIEEGEGGGVFMLFVDLQVTGIDLEHSRNQYFMNKQASKSGFLSPSTN